MLTKLSERVIRHTRVCGRKLKIHELFKPIYILLYMSLNIRYSSGHYALNI